MPKPKVKVVNQRKGGYVKLEEHRKRAVTLEKKKHQGPRAAGSGR